MMEPVYSPWGEIQHCKANPDITGQMLLQPVKRKAAPLRMSTMGKRG